MHFILANGAIATFDTIRKEYETKKGVDLDKEPSFISRPISLGGTNVRARNKQISFLEKLKIILQPNLLKEEEIDTQEKFVSHVTYSRAFIAVCMYIKDQVGRNWDSKLCELIDTKLGLTSTNFMDEADKKVCYQAANRILSSPKFLDEANLELSRHHRKSISETEWQEFIQYLSSKATEEKVENPLTNYPITSITKPLCGTVFGYTGATVGFLGGDVVTNSIGGMSVRYKVTAVVGGILLLGPVSPTGVALFAPVIAGKLVNTFCKISMAHVLGVTMSWVGQGVGIGVGLPLDLAYRLIWNTCAVIANYYAQGGKPEALNGIRIEDGVLMFGGVPVETINNDKLLEHQNNLIELDKLPTNHELVEIDTKGDIFVNGKLVEASDTEVKIPTELLAELKKAIKAHHKDKPRNDETPRIEELDQATLAAM